MPNYSKNINLILPFQNENYNVDVANANNNAIDSELGRKVSKVNGKGLSTNDFTNAYKTKVDKLSNMFYVRGAVNTFEDLSNIENPKNNDIYLVKQDNFMYSYSDQGWIDLGLIVDMEVIEAEMLEKIEAIQGTVTIASGTTITNGYEVTLPLYYQVGNNSLEMRADSEVMRLKTNNVNGHYIEVGNTGALSNKIQFYRTSSEGSWTLDEDLILTCVVRGVSQE